MISPKLKWGLAVSLALNVFLLGGIAGAMYRWSAAGPQLAAAAAAAQQRGLRFAAEGLPTARQQEFNDALRAARRDVAPAAREARETRRELAQLLARPELDRAAVDAALARTRDADMVVRSRVEGEVVRFAASLPPEQRGQFVQGLVQRGPLRAAEQIPAAKGAPRPAAGTVQNPGEVRQ